MKERWSYAELQSLRRTLLDECEGRAPEMLAAVARDLVGSRQGQSFRPALRALARLRGVESDPAFLYRGSLRAVARPEVVDPDGANPQCRDQHVTFYLPYILEDPGAVRLEIVVASQDGATVWEGVVEEETTVKDLLSYRPSCEIPGAALEDGEYTIRVAVFLDGQGPRPGDLLVEARFHVLRGFQQRAENLARRRLERESERELDPVTRAILWGTVAQVGRVYRSEPAAGRSDPRRELWQAERVVENLRRERNPLAGLEGRLDLALPAGPGDEVAFVTLLLPPADSEPRPLVLFLPGGPTFDHESDRPTSPRVTSPGWWADLLIDRDFGRLGPWNWAVMESPGRVPSSSEALVAVVSALGELLDVPEGQLCLVGERQGAWVAGHSLSYRKPFKLSALVLLVAGGNLPLEKLEERGLRALGIPSLGHASSPALENLAKRDDSGRLHMLDPTSRPWPVVLGISLGEIEKFLEKLPWKR
jgi:hypothetical protein